MIACNSLTLTELLLSTHTQFAPLQKCAGSLSISGGGVLQTHPTGGFTACIKAIHSQSSVRGLVKEACDFCSLNSFGATVQFVSHRNMGNFFSTDVWKAASLLKDNRLDNPMTEEHTFPLENYLPDEMSLVSGCHIFSTQCFVYLFVSFAVSFDYLYL